VESEKFGFREKSTKTRIETNWFTIIFDIHSSFREKSTKTRIETGSMSMLPTMNFRVLEKNPPKQGLKRYFGFT